MEKALEIWRIFIEAPNAVIAGFTVVLVVVTITYTVVTWRLLKQSRDAFVADLFYKLGENILSLIGEAEKPLTEGARRKVMTASEGFRAGFAQIDRKLGKRVNKLYSLFLEAALEQQREAEAKLDEKDKELEKQKKELGAKKGELRKKM
ncbi:hypothetical protein ES703_83756 [subsurface metagenome]